MPPPRVAKLVSPVGDSEDKRAKARAARFAADATKPPPPTPERKFAHPGGKVTSNKAEATAKFLARRERESMEGGEEAETPTKPPAAASSDQPRVDKLFVGNLSYQTTSASLGKLFTDAGFEVVGSKIVSDRTTGRSKGFGFVTFVDETQTREAERSFSQTSVGGRVLTVKAADQRGTKAAATSQKKKQLRKPKNSGWGGAGAWATPDSDEEEEVATPEKVKTEEPELLILNAEKPLETATPCEAVAMWKICFASDLEAWRKTGLLSGSEMDQKDGFHHFSNAEMVKKVAAMFFDKQGAALLCIEPDRQPAKTRWTAEDPSDADLAAALAKEQDEARSYVRYIADGCIHLHAKKTWSFDVVSATYDLPFDEASGTHTFPKECVLRQGPMPMTIGGLTIKY